MQTLVLFFQSFIPYQKVWASQGLGNNSSETFASPQAEPANNIGTTQCSRSMPSINASQSTTHLTPHQILLAKPGRNLPYPPPTLAGHATRQAAKSLTVGRIGFRRCFKHTVLSQVGSPHLPRNKLACCKARSRRPPGTVRAPAGQLFLTCSFLKAHHAPTTLAVQSMTKNPGRHGANPAEHRRNDPAPNWQPRAEIAHSARTPHHTLTRSAGQQSDAEPLA